MSRCLWRRFAPEFVGDPIDRDNRAAVKTKQGKQRALARAAEDDRLASLADFERAEETELKHR